MSTRWVRSISLVVLVCLTAMTCLLTLVARNLVRDQGDRLLTERAGEVGALLTNSFSGVEATLRSLSSLVTDDDVSRDAFTKSASPLVVGQTRAILLVRIRGARIERAAMVGDGVPDGPLAGDRASLIGRAAREPGVVTGLVTDGSRRRVGLALARRVGGIEWVVFQESALDPNYPDPTTAGAPFSELDVALYASPTARDDRLVLATTRDVPLTGDVSAATVPVGVDRWLVLVSAPHSLVGSFALKVPWFLFAGGLLAALLAAAVVEVVGRRRDFALALVDERTASLQSTVRSLEDAQDELFRHALHDGLTRLPNRTLLLDRLEHALGRAQRSPAYTAVMFLDLDRFKLVNDSLGHEIGDRLLVGVGTRFATAIRPGDTVARLGGDEFVVLCEGLDGVDEAYSIASRLRHSLIRSFEFDGREIRATASIGLAIVSPPDTDATAETLIRDADLAMYRAKERGRDRVELFDHSLRLRAVAQLETEIALRRAIEQGELVVHYQPVVRLDTRSVVGVEALVRWNDPLRGLIGPDEFIPMAEEGGLIGPIGAFVMSEACSRVAAWNRARDSVPLTVSVNLSARQLDVDELIESVTSTLAVTGLDPALLWLEITETSLMEDMPSTLATLHALKSLGVTLVVDDFGTGYSSLLYLRRFPIDVLKVDRSFVAGLGRTAEDTAIVVGVVRLAQMLGLSVVAEGVETDDQAGLLALLDCEMAQGFHWSSPLAAEDLTAWFAAPTLDMPSPISDEPRIRVLVVDDQPAMRDLLRLRMQLAGSFDVIAEASNGSDAVELARAHQPDLVVLDLVMPVLGGAAAAPLILDVAPRAKVVVVSAHEPDGFSSHGSLGVIPHFDKSDLGAVVRRLSALFDQSSSRV